MFLVGASFFLIFFNFFWRGGRMWRFLGVFGGFGSGRESAAGALAGMLAGLGAYRGVENPRGFWSFWEL
jgi:hypothetical protein